ncbi:hypothetical protein TNIN_29811 [Trichonephila inaurata madagascariensis]|uniref:Uncharacterized protein n=1 Tax=Trichonephila inaurata madagascariensis TaxID=2747483 RepID=A0A8X6XDV7_9ARAC|nr:hypothetical protein TNIN_29811 [Trichonephila inaurata madagascariensis]
MKRSYCLLKKVKENESSERIELASGDYRKETSTERKSETNSLRNIYMVKEKEYQFDELSQMIDTSMKQLDWTNIRRPSEANQTRWKLSLPSAPWWG